jgi:hypothetical protein
LGDEVVGLTADVQPDLRDCMRKLLLILNAMVTSKFAAKA